MNDLDKLMPAFTELYVEWCRLKGYSLGKAPIEIMIDEATGHEAARMKEFVSWLSLEILPRLDAPPNQSPEEV